MPAIDQLEEATLGRCDDHEVTVPVRLVHDVLAEVRRLEDRIEFAEAFLPDGVELP